MPDTKEGQVAARVDIIKNSPVPVDPGFPDADIAGDGRVHSNAAFDQILTATLNLFRHVEGSGAEIGQGRI